MPKFVARERKHKVRRRLDGDHSRTGNDRWNSNAAEILPSNQIEREQKRAELKTALKAGQPKISGKKQKRLDNYIVCSFDRFSPRHEANNSF